MKRCEICQEITPPEELASLAGFTVCGRCRTGDPRPGMRANGFRHAVNVHEFRGGGSGSSSTHLLHVIVRRPAELEAVGLLRPAAHHVMPPMPIWKRLFWKPDPDDPDPEIMLEVEIVDPDPLHEFVLNDLVAHTGVRETLKTLALFHADVHLGFAEEAIKVSRPIDDPLPEGDEVLRPLFLLSLHRQRLGI